MGAQCNHYYWRGRSHVAHEGEEAYKEYYDYHCNAGSFQTLQSDHAGVRHVPLSTQEPYILGCYQCYAPINTEKNYI